MKRTTRTALTAVPVSLALLLAGACSDDDGDDAAATTTTEVSSSSETTAPPGSETTAPPENETTAPPETPTTQTTAPPPTEAPTGDTAPPEDGTEGQFGTTPAAQLIRAWGAGDRDRALQLARPEAVDTLFAYADPGGDDWELIGCEGAAGTLYCTFESPSKPETITVHQPNVPLEDTGEPAPIGTVDIA